MFVPMCVLPGSTGCDGLRDRDTDGCVTQATPINPKNPHKNLANAGAEEREGTGIYLPSKQFHLTLSTRIRPNGSNVLINQKKKKAFFWRLEFRAFNLSVTCSAIRTVRLPPYLSNARVSTKDSYLQMWFHIIFLPLYPLTALSAILL